MPSGVRTANSSSPSVTPRDSITSLVKMTPREFPTLRTLTTAAMGSSYAGMSYNICITYCQVGDSNFGTTGPWSSRRIGGYEGGAQLARLGEPSAVGILGEAATHAVSLADAFEHVVRYVRLVHQGVTINIAVKGDYFSANYHWSSSHGRL